VQVEGRGEMERGPTSILTLLLGQITSHTRYTST